MNIELAQANTERMDEVRELFLEYQDWLGFDLGFQNFREELAALPGAYAPPGGGLYLVLVEDQAAGCGAFRPFSPGICEMKRLYVRERYRGLGLGRRLAQRVVGGARTAGYAAMRLDTIETMKAARGLYASLGFRAIPAYRDNPIEGAEFLELRLAAVGDQPAEDFSRS